jgi:hypothetical protein
LIYISRGQFKKPSESDIFVANEDLGCNLVASLAPTPIEFTR